MSIFNLDSSLERAARRLGGTRRRRSDAGVGRLPARLERVLEQQLQVAERPRIRDVERTLVTTCARLGLRVPARATIYNAIERCPAPTYHGRALPAAVQRALYNVDLDAEIDAAQIAFYAFNYGELEAVCWASALPWLALHHALRMRGWRPKSRGLLLAVAHRRRIS